MEGRDYLSSVHPSTGRLVAPTCSCDRQRVRVGGSILGRQKMLGLIFFQKYF